jgi:signal transduction histidine kinase
MRTVRLPRVLVGAGVALSAIIVGEVLAFVILPIALPLPHIGNMVTTLPFVVLLGYGGYWLATRQKIDVERYDRMAWWIGAGTAFFGLCFTFVALTTQSQPLIQFGIVRWSLAVGGGIGFLIAVFEASAIEKALSAERAQIRNEELKRQNERLEEFAGIIAHDLRNPLNVATGQLQTLKEECNSDRLEVGASALSRMQAIIEDTLTLARSGKIIDGPESVSLGESARRSWENVSTGDASLVVVDSTGVSADPDRLSRLLENLYRNAIDHGRSDVTIRVGSLSSGFYVEDDGPGIPGDERGSVLEAGYSTKEENTGFGLAIVQQIATAHGWTVAITEGTDGGARFEFTGVDVGGSSVPGESPTMATLTV